MCIGQGKNVYFEVKMCILRTKCNLTGQKYSLLIYTHEQKKGNTLKLCYYPRTVFYCSNFFAYIENITISLFKTALVFFLGKKNNDIARKIKQKVQKSTSQKFLLNVAQ